MSTDTTPSPEPAATKLKLPKEQSLILGILGARERGKKQYGKAKGYMEELKKLVKPGKLVQLGDGRRFKVVDTFAGDAEYAKKMTIIDRFELQQEK